MGRVVVRQVVVGQVVVGQVVVGQVVMGQVVMGQVVMVVSNVPHHCCDACGVSLLALLAASGPALQQFSVHKAPGSFAHI